MPTSIALSRPKLKTTFPGDDIMWMALPIAMLCVALSLAFGSPLFRDAVAAEQGPIDTTPNPDF